MHEAFRVYVDLLHPSLERLIGMSPLKTDRLPRDLPEEYIYLFGEDENHLYVGRTRKLRQRLRQHSIPSAPQNQASFAFRLACEVRGRTEASYKTKDSRDDLCDDPNFAEIFTQAKARVRKMDVRFVAENDPLRQALLEMYVSIVLKTRYNDFETH